MSAPPLCKNCGGGLPQHQEGPCWCKACLEGPAAERCREYVPRPPKATKDDTAFGKKPPKPPKKAPKSMTGSGDEEAQEPLLPEPPPLGTPQRGVLDIIHAAGASGCTDSEIALKTDQDRATVAVMRNELVSEGLLWDSGLRRRDQRGHENVAWVATQTEVSPESDDAPLLVREDVYVTQDRNASTLHAGSTRIRVPSAPGDPVEVTTRPRRSDPDQEGGNEVTLLLVVDGSDDVYAEARNPFLTSSDIVEMMADLVSPAINALTSARRDL